MNHRAKYWVLQAPLPDRRRKLSYFREWGIYGAEAGTSEGCPKPIYTFDITRAFRFKTRKDAWSCINFNYQTDHCTPRAVRYK